MGGANEFKTPAKSTESDKQGEKIGDLRIHTNNGEVHFHDDAKGLKVAVPVDKMYAAWDKLSSGQKKKFKFCDHSNKTELRMEVIAVARKDRPDLTDALIEVRPLSGKKLKAQKEAKHTTPEFQQFDKFIKG